jgi:citrate synthase
VADTITIIDNRTGKEITVDINNGVFPSSALRELDPDLRMYDPAFLSTARVPAITSSTATLASCATAAPDRAAWRSRPISRSRLLLNGELPPRTSSRSGPLTSRTTRSSTRTCARFMDGFHYDAHPMGMLV